MGIDSGRAHDALASCRSLQQSYGDWQTTPSALRLAILMLQAELVGNGDLAI